MLCGGQGQRMHFGVTITREFQMLVDEVIE
jgi:hypothetical protein